MYAKFKLITLLIFVLFINFIHAAGVPAFSSQEFKRIEDEIKNSILNADIVTPAIWRRFMDDLKKIDLNGSLEQKHRVEALLSENNKEVKYTLRKQLNNLIYSIFSDKEVQGLIKRIGMAAFQGALPAIALHVMIASISGQTTVEAAQAAALNGAVMGALGNLLNSAYEGALGKAYESAKVITILNATKDLFQAKNPVILLKAPIMSGIGAMSVDTINQMIAQAGGMPKLLQKLDWVGSAIEQKTKAGALVQSSHGQIFQFLVNNLEKILANEKIREYLAAVTIAAVHSALVAIIFQKIGLGYVNEELPYAALRGAIEGLFNYATYQNLNIGLLNQASTGILARSVEKYITTSKELSLKDVAPSVLQSLTISATNQVISKSGGWGTAIKNVFNSIKNIKWLPYKPIGLATEPK